MALAEGSQSPFGAGFDMGDIDRGGDLKTLCRLGSEPCSGRGGEGKTDGNPIDERSCSATVSGGSRAVFTDPIRFRGLAMNGDEALSLGASSSVLVLCLE